MGIRASGLRTSKENKSGFPPEKNTQQETALRQRARPAELMRRAAQQDGACAGKDPLPLHKPESISIVISNCREGTMLQDSNNCQKSSLIFSFAALRTWFLIRFRDGSQSTLHTRDPPLAECNLLKFPDFSRKPLSIPQPPHLSTLWSVFLSLHSEGDISNALFLVLYFLVSAEGNCETTVTPEPRKRL